MVLVATVASWLFLVSLTHLSFFGFCGVYVGLMFLLQFFCVTFKGSEVLKVFKLVAVNLKIV